MYEEDEEGNRVRGSSRSARKREKEEKERRRPKVSHRSSDKKHSKSDSGVEPPGYGTQAVMSGARQDDDPGSRGITTVERRRSSAGTSSKSKKYESPKSPSKSKGPRKDEAKYFGIAGPSNPIPTPMAQPFPIRTRPTVVTAQSYPTRPTSYHQAYSATTGYGPPISNPGFWQNQHQGAYYPPLAQSATFVPNTPSPLDYPAQSPLAPRPLSSRFGTPTRTGSGFGYRERDTVIQQRPRDDYEDEYASAAEGALPRASIRVPSDRKLMRTQAEIDSLNMPPPPRRSTAGRPGPSILRRSTDYPVGLAVPPEPEYQPRDDRAYREERQPRRSSVNRLSGTYEYNDRHIEAANSGRRRQSYYGQSASMGSGASGGGGWEDKAAQATSYQDGVSGSASASAVPLTADLLRRQQRRQGGSSRSTKSSGSRDESDYRQSATTRTTRSVSSPEDENVTIKVTGGQARVTIDGAQIDCNDGGEIEIRREKSLKGSQSTRGGSEWSNSEYGGAGSRRIDDRKSRVDRPAGQSRRGSVSYARPSPQYAPHSQYLQGEFI